MKHQVNHVFTTVVIILLINGHAQLDTVSFVNICIIKQNSNPQLNKQTQQLCRVALLTKLHGKIIARMYKATCL